LPLLVFSGCATAYKERVNQALWERELRLEEDCNWKLRWQMEDMQRQLDEANQRAGTARKEADIFRDQNGAASGPDLNGPPPAFNPSSSSRGSESPTLPPAPKLPEIEQGQQFNPSAPPSSGKKSSGNGASSSPNELRGPALSKAEYLAPVDQVPNAAEKLNPNVEVERISLNPGLTGALDTHGDSKDEQLSVAIEQRDAGDRRVLAPGDVSIVVVDPALAGTESRIARWNFDSDEVARHVRKNHDGGSLQFELPWPKLPEHSDLRLFVRFTTFDGRRLEANLPIDVKLADSKPGEWTKAKLATTGRNTDSRDTDWTDAPPAKRSVYDRNADDSESETNSDKPQREAARNRPAWSPYR
jgi:hypothetical protein